MIPAKQEMELLLACSSVLPLTPRQIARIGELTDGIDWDYLLACARKHGLSGLLYWNLRTSCAHLVPPPYLDALAREFAGTLATGQQQIAELNFVLDKLQAAHLFCWVLKGVVLAERYYGSRGFRAAADIDILVCERQLGAVVQTLVQAGYKPLSHKSLLDSQHPYLQSADLKELRGLCTQYPFERNGLILDVHWQLTDPGFMDAPGQWLDKTEYVFMFGRKVPCPPEHLLLIFLCVHGAKHTWSDLRWIVDVAAVLRRGNPNWTQLLADARRLGCERMLYLGLFLAAQLPNAPELPLSQDRNYGAAVSAGKTILTILLGDPPEHLWCWRTASRWLYFISLKSSLIAKIKLVFFLVFHPALPDWKAAPVRQSWRWLNWLLRPSRLLAVHARSFAGRLLRGEYLSPGDT